MRHNGGTRDDPQIGARVVRKDWSAGADDMLLTAPFNRDPTQHILSYRKRAIANLPRLLTPAEHSGKS